MKASRTKEKKFNRLVIVTIIAVYLLILAGGIVRSTGSGMGCPDWPKCFGAWVPPTSESEIPENYQNTFAQVRVNKNLRLAEYLDFFGFHTMAESLRSESIAAPEAEFNKFKTWTEYINRLLGVAIGMLIALMTFVSINFRKVQPKIFYGSITALILVVFQGWIGSLVVSTNLLPGMVTFHMALAVILIFLLVYLCFISLSKGVQITDKLKSGRIKTMLIISLVLLSIQITVGTQVREAIDLIALKIGPSGRDLWVDNLAGTFFFHRSFSLIILGVSGYLFLLLKKLKHPDYHMFALAILLIVIIEILLGVYMAYFGIPPWAQPLHLFAGLLLLGLQFWLYLKTSNIPRA